MTKQEKINKLFDKVLKYGNNFESYLEGAYCDICEEKITGDHYYIEDYFREEELTICEQCGKELKGEEK